MRDDFKRTPVAGRGGTIQPSYARMPTPHTAVGSGLLLRGVVTRVYLYGEAAGQVSLYCDVLVYSGHPAVRAWPLSEVLVTSNAAGVHDGEIYVPKAALRDLVAGTEGVLSRDAANLDGDHVIVGFIDDNRTLPVLLRYVAHPQADIGQPASGIDALGEIPLGHRLRITRNDTGRIPGDGVLRKRPRFVKHNGTFFGVDDAGNFVVDARRAHRGDNGDGTPIGGGGYLPTGAEITSSEVAGAPPRAACGNLRVLLPALATAVAEADFVEVGRLATHPAVHGDAWQTNHASYDADLEVVVMQLKALVQAAVTAADLAASVPGTVTTAYATAATPILVAIDMAVTQLKTRMADTNNLSTAVLVR